MKATSFLLGILLIVCAYEVCQAQSSSAHTCSLGLPNCDILEYRLACLARKYRTFDGTCNNLCYITRGAANRPLRRLPTLVPPAAYEPGFQPRRVASNPSFNLTNTRNISRTVFVTSNNQNVNYTAPEFTHLTMTWGQFLDHDITLTDLTPNVTCGTNNEPCPQTDGCVGIDILAGIGNELPNNQSAQCIPLRRSRRNADGEQINLVTSYIDGSQVYGSDNELAMRLRSPLGLGRLDERPLINTGDRPILPSAEPEAFCRSPDPEQASCFLAGDVRVNENQALMAMHTLWVREHNRIATALHVLNPVWGNDRLFLEARKIVGAEIQHITYNEWLAVLFDENLRNSTGLLLEPDGEFFTGYDPTVNPEMINSFSTAALRMGHSLIRPSFPLLFFRPQGFSLPPVILVRDYFNPSRFFDETANNVFSGIMLGLAGRRARQIDNFFVPAVIDELIFEGPTFDGIVGDLPAINMQRGRDHGLPGYVFFRQVCGGRPATDFSDLLDTISQTQIDKLKLVYADVTDIDIFAGGMSEFPTEGSALGLTFTCILTQQFKDVRFGDRFWYERYGHETGFTFAQLTELRKASIARVMCDNLDGFEFIKRKAFLRRTSTNPTVSCTDVEFVDLNVFTDGSGVGSSSHVTYGANVAGGANAHVGAWSVPQVTN